MVKEDNVIAKINHPYLINARIQILDMTVYEAEFLPAGVIMLVGTPFNKAYPNAVKLVIKEDGGTNV